MLSFFHSDENRPVVRACLKINSRGLQMVSPHILSTLILILFSPWALFELRLTKIFSILSAVKLIVRNLLSPTNLGLVEGLLQFFSKEH